MASFDIIIKNEDDEVLSHTNVPRILAAQIAQALGDGPAVEKIGNDPREDDHAEGHL